MDSYDKLAIALRDFDLFVERIKKTFDGKSSYYGIDFKRMFEDFESVIDDLSDASERVYRESK